MTMKTFQDTWLSYKDNVIPKDAPPIQLKETKRAFYAGARGLFILVMNRLDPGAEPTDADLAFMDSLDRELREFFKLVLEDKD